MMMSLHHVAVQDVFWIRIHICQRIKKEAELIRFLIDIMSLIIRPII